MAITDEQLIEIIKTCMKQSEKRLAELASRYAVDRMLEHLEHIGVLDENGYAKPGQRLKIRVVDSACYPPIWVQ